jgi:hypothetical protein
LWISKVFIAYTVARKPSSREAIANASSNDMLVILPRVEDQILLLMKSSWTPPRQSPKWAVILPAKQLDLDRRHLVYYNPIITIR